MITCVLVVLALASVWMMGDFEEWPGEWHYIPAGVLMVACVCLMFMVNAG
jgi:hypothetical protein